MEALVRKLKGALVAPFTSGGKMVEAIKKVVKKKEPEKPKKYVYRSVSMGTQGYPSRIKYYKQKGWTEDCTEEEIKNYLSPMLKHSLTPFRLMRKEVDKCENQ